MKRYFFLSVLILFICPSSVSAAGIVSAANSSGLQQRTVSVAYYHHGNFFYKSDDGIYSGYDAEYLYEIAKYTGWNYTFVDFPTFKSALAATEEGKVDLIPDILSSPERRGKLIYSEKSMGKNYITLIVPADDTLHYSDDYQSLRKMKVGVLSGWLDTDSFRRFDKMHGLNAEIIELNSYGELFTALSNHTIDGAAISFLGEDQRYRIVAVFDPMEVFFAAPHRCTDIMRVLNDAADKISLNNPAFQWEITKKYFTPVDKEPFELTEQESEFVALQNTIPVVLYENNPPYSYRQKDGTFGGVLPRMFKKIAAMSGLTFSFTAARTADDAVAQLKHGSARIIAQLIDDQPGMIAQGIRLTDSYLEPAVSVIMPKNARRIEHAEAPLFLEQKLGADELISGNKTMIYYGVSVIDCFKRANHKKNTAVICDSLTTDYLLSHSSGMQYSVSPVTGVSYAISCGVSVADDNRLYSILNKAVQHIQSSELSSLSYSYSITEESPVFSFIERLPPEMIAGYIIVLLIATVALILSIIILRKHTRREKELTVQQEQMKQDEKMCSDQTKFFGNVSREMRMPLSGIIGYTQVALESTDTSSVTEYLKKIKKTGQQLFDLMNDSLIIIKTETSTYELHPSIVKFSELLETAVSPAKTVALRKEINFIVDVSKAYKGYINVDKQCLQKILSNLLTNAVKFTPAQGNVMLSVEHFEKYVNGVNCRIIVSDTGVGMSKDFLSKIYEPFVQETMVATDTSGGTGLGLSIVKRLVDSMHGRIVVQSVRGEGTVFTVYLPISTVANYNPSSVSVQNGRKFAGKKILLCEDNEMNMEIARLLLEKNGMRVVCAENGKEGVERIRASAENEFDAILMDLRMPVMDGYEAAKKIRTMPRSDAPVIPIIALTADAYDSNLHSVKASGMNGYVEKPIDPAQLLNELVRLLKLY